MQFVIPGQLPGLNQILDQYKRSRYHGAAQKKSREWDVRWAIRASRCPGTFTEPVVIIVEWTEPNRRRDIDNVQAGIKFIMDALVHEGVIPNDTRKWVKSVIHDFPEPDKKSPRIVVTLHEASKYSSGH